MRHQMQIQKRKKKKLNIVEPRKPNHTSIPPDFTIKQLVKSIKQSSSYKSISNDDQRTESRKCYSATIYALLTDQNLSIYEINDSFTRLRQRLGVKKTCQQIHHQALSSFV